MLVIICTWKSKRMGTSNLTLMLISWTWGCTTFHNFISREKNQKLAGLWLVGLVVNHVGIYGSKVAEGLSAFQRRSCSHMCWFLWLAKSFLWLSSLLFNLSMISFLGAEIQVFGERLYLYLTSGNSWFKTRFNIANGSGNFYRHCWPLLDSAWRLGGLLIVVPLIVVICYMEVSWWACGSWLGLCEIASNSSKAI